MKTFRRVVFWSHLVVGLAVGSVVFLMATTGALLAYERQIVTWAERGLRAAPPTPDSPRLPLATLLEKARAAAPPSDHGPAAAPTALTLRADPAAPALVAFGRDKIGFIDPYTGASMGEGATGARGFFHFVNGLHRWLATSETYRPLGKGVTGACCLGFLGLVISGLVLWWPRRWTKNSVRAVAVPNLRLRGKARDFNWHNAIGLWAAPLLVLTTLTGTVMAYDWANNLLFRLTGNEPPPARQAGGGGGGRRERGPGANVALPANLDALWARAAGQVAGWQTITLRLPESPAAPLAFAIDRGTGGQPQLKDQLTLNARTGEVVKWEPFASNNLGRRLRLWARFVHTGEAGLWVGQTLAVFAALSATVLVWTGFALAWRRFSGKSKRPPGPAVVSPVAAEPSFAPTF